MLFSNHILWLKLRVECVNEHLLDNCQVFTDCGSMYSTSAGDTRCLYS